MKKYIIIVVYLFVSILSYGQGMRTIKENFEENKFNWDEISTKLGSAFLINGELVIKNGTNETNMNSICNLPIIYDEDYKVTTTLNNPKINDKEYVGIIFNYEDEEDFWVFLVKEKESFIGRFKNGKYIRVRTNPIILKKGNKSNVILEMEKKGKNIIFRVDNMDVKTHPINIINNTFGFIIYGKGELKVSALEVSQYERIN